MIDDQTQLQNNTANNLLSNEAAGVELTSKAGGAITRNLVKKGEELLSQGNAPGTKMMK